MTSLEKVELASGVLAGSLGAVVIPLSVLADNIRLQQARGAGLEPVGLVVGIALVLVLFIAPSLLVVYGAYLHAVSGEPRGQAMVSAGSLFLLVSFGLCVCAAGYLAAYLIWVRLSLVIVSVLAWIASRRVMPRAPGRQSEL